MAGAGRPAPVRCSCSNGESQWEKDPLARVVKLPAAAAAAAAAASALTLFGYYAVSMGTSFCHPARMPTRMPASILRPARPSSKQGFLLSQLNAGYLLVCSRNTKRLLPVFLATPAQPTLSATSPALPDVVCRPLAMLGLFVLASATLGVTWKLTRRRSAPQIAHDHALKMAIEPPSSLFPNRPIRPMPKRRLRERLSPEVADTIRYPPLPQSSTSLFSYPYPLAEDHPDAGPAPARESGPYPERQPQNNGVRHEREDEDTPLRQTAALRASLQHANLAARPKAEQGRYADSLPLLSTASSAEGYDPFENTNNKKRKIPTAGDSAPSGVHASNDPVTGASSLAPGAQPAEGQGEAATSTSTPYDGSGSFASNVHNVPGPGRGRYGRPRSGKNQLRPLFDSTNSWAGRTTKPRPGQWGVGTSMWGRDPGVRVHVHG